jgi:hypothetical protein
MEAITIREIVRELRSECVPGRVQAVFQSSSQDIVLTIRNRSTRHLVLSVRPALPSAHLASRKPRALPAPTAFCSLLRKHLAGMALTDILDPGLERAVHLLFAASAAAPLAFRLTVEIMGRWSNIVLMEGDSLRIVDALRRVPPHPGRERAIVQGEIYRPPPSGGRAYLETIGEEQFQQLQERSEKEGLPLHAKLVGLGPGLLALAKARPGESLLESIRAVVREIDEGKARPVYYPGSGRLLPLPLPGEGEEEAVEFQSMSAAADHAFRNTADGEERAGLKKSALPVTWVPAVRSGPCRRRDALCWRLWATFRAVRHLLSCATRKIRARPPGRWNSTLQSAPGRMRKDSFEKRRRRACGRNRLAGGCRH